MRTNKSILLLLAFFLATNMLGLAAANQMQEIPAIQDASEQHQSPVSGIYFFALIGVSTLILLALYKYNANLVLKGWFSMALFITTLLFFGVFLPAIPAVAISAVMVLARFKLTDNPYLTNVLTVFSFAGAGAYFGSLIGYKAVIVMMAVLSLYDYFSVNISKHMIKLAKSGVETNTFMGFTYPKDKGGVELEDIDEPSEDVEERDMTEEDAKAKTDGRQVGILGGGDVVIPLAFAASILQPFGIVPAVASVFGAMFGLWFLLTNAQQGKFYPAIPPVVIGAVIAAGIPIILGMM